MLCHANAMLATCCRSLAWLLLLLLVLVAAVVVEARDTAVTTAPAAAASCSHTSSAAQDTIMHASQVSVMIGHWHGAYMLIALHSGSASTPQAAGM
jgi:hypothetical protein